MLEFDPSLLFFCEESVLLAKPVNRVQTANALIKIGKTAAGRLQAA